MAGASITLLTLDDDLTGWWDAPVQTPALRWGLEAVGDPGWEIPDAPGNPRALMAALDARLPAQRALVTDAGHSQGWPPMLRVIGSA